MVFSPSIPEPQIDFHGELIGAIFSYEGQMLPKLGSFTCGDVAATAAYIVSIRSLFDYAPLGALSPKEPF